jgi:hypothetical protein
MKIGQIVMSTTAIGDRLFKNTVEAVIRNGDQGDNPA